MGTEVCLKLMEYHQARVFEKGWGGRYFGLRERGSDRLVECNICSHTEIYEHIHQKLLPAVLAMKMAAAVCLKVCNTSCLVVVDRF
jgi:hypothetical protein